MSLRTKIMWPEQRHIDRLSDKISIIGAGMVGMAVAVSLLGTKVTRNLVLVDAFGDKVKGEILDLMHGALFLKHPLISGGNNFADTQGSKLCIITAGLREEAGESKISLAQRNADIVSKMVPELVKNSPDTIILVVGNPCDLLTYVTWKVSGLPCNRVIGSGTTVDTQRFKFGLAKKFNVNPANIHGWIIGEHGEKSIAVWSSVNIGGIRIQHLNPRCGTEDDPENWEEIHKDIVAAADAIQELKGYINWGVGMSVASIANAIVKNNHSIFPVSVNANGKYGIEHDIFIPMPAVLGCNGVTDIVNLDLNEREFSDLQSTANTLKQIQDSVKIKMKEVKCKCRRCL